MSSESRERMVQSAASLIAARGLSATSFSDVIEASQAPRGSIYHHFPEGKSELAAAAVGYTADRVLAFLRAGKETTPKGVMKRFTDVWRRVVVTSKATSGCVVAGVAVDRADDDVSLARLVRTTFRSWTDELARQLAETGVPAKRASALALTALAAMEGALILCRAEGGVEPLDAVAHELLRLLDRA